jgi:hypothetical protein
LVRFLGLVFSQPQDRHLYRKTWTQKSSRHTYIHASNGIGTRDLSVWASEDMSSSYINIFAPFHCNFELVKRTCMKLRMAGPPVQEWKMKNEVGRADSYYELYGGQFARDVTFLTCINYGVRFESRLRHRMSWLRSREISHSLQTNARRLPPLQPSPLPSTSFPVHEPCVKLELDTKHTEALAASLNKYGKCKAIPATGRGGP